MIDPDDTLPPTAPSTIPSPPPDWPELSPVTFLPVFVPDEFVSEALDE